jgi:ribose transport system permease protein
VLVMVTAVTTWVLRRTRTGLRLYAVGSDRQAAFLAGLDVRRATITAYAIGGTLAALAGLATTAITGAGEARAAIGNLATLNSVAAVVLGGIVLGGGRGSLIGAAAAGYVLYMLSPILTALGVDPNTAEVVKGVLLIVVVMTAALIQSRRSQT